MTSPMSMIAVVGVTRSPFDRDRLGAGDPQLLNGGPDVTRPDEVVRLAGTGWHRRLRVIKLEDDPGPGQRDQSGGDARGFEIRVQLADQIGRADALHPRRPGSPRAGRASGS